MEICKCYRWLKKDGRGVNMRDFNFFEPYLEKDFKVSKNLFLYLVLLLGLVSLSIYGIYNQIKINNLMAENIEKKFIAENPSVVSKVMEVKEKEDALNQFSEEVDNIKKINEYIEKSNIVNTSFIKLITSKMPEELYMTSMNISSTNIGINGVSQDRLSIAQFKKGLESIEEIKEIFVSNINRNEEGYSYDMSILLEVIFDE